MCDPLAASRCGPGPGPSPPPPRTPWAWRGGGRSPPATPGQRRRPRRHRADAELGACRCREHRRPPVRLCVSQIAHLQTEALKSRRSAGLRGGHLATWPRAACSQSRSRAGAAVPAGARRAIHHAKPSQPGVKRRLRGLWSGASHFVREAGQWEGCPTGPQGDPRTPAGGRGHLPFPALSADSSFLLLAGPFPFFSFLAQLKQRHRQAEGVLLRQGAPPAPTHRARRPELRRRPRPLLPPLPPFPVEFTAWGRRIVSVSRAGTCWPTHTAGHRRRGGPARREGRASVGDDARRIRAVLPIFENMQDEGKRLLEAAEAEAAHPRSGGQPARAPDSELPSNCQV